MRLQPCFFLAAVLILAAGCSGEKKPAPVSAPAGNDAMAGSPAQSTPVPTGEGNEELRIDPPEAYRGTVLRAHYSSALPAGATVQWMVNGSAAHGSGFTFDTVRLRKGDRIQVRMTGGGASALSREATIRNTPPEIRWIRFVLGEGGRGNSIGVETEAFDGDGDPMRVFIEWRKNGVPAGTGNRLEVAVKRGDKIDVTVTPHDGEAAGKSATLYREIRNSAPAIEGQEQFKVEGSAVTFRVRASDPDGDRLAYSVKDPPAGMKIDRETGWVRWETAPGATGKVPFTVTVSDGNGGEATARFNVTIAEQPSSPVR